ncbi:hypothetical protein M1P56_09825 [Streptomyces sp. HU2014]|uniref:hypothetical protein n=1 Tax=Streptomyces sp. HU2014 TaxID=2939414 RepID=UPI00200E0B94|nr:hypothetical protein [Streptomyces sp. HU2014]UQI44624.1 hypothetical protein M1P56_09825 [Streptomyces sp. HU2014]
MLTYPTWSSRQLVSATDLNQYLHDNTKQLTSPSALRVKGLDTLTSFTSRTPVKWDQIDFQRQGWSSSNMTKFKCPSAGTYFVTANFTFRPPSDMDGKKAAMLDAVVSTSAPNDDSTYDALKSLTTTKIIGSYVSVNTSGLVHIPEGFLLFAHVAGWGGTWTKPPSENASWSMNSLSAVQVAPDAKELGG